MDKKRKIKEKNFNKIKVNKMIDIQHTIQNDIYGGLIYLFKISTEPPNNLLSSICTY